MDIKTLDVFYLNNFGECQLYNVFKVGMNLGEKNLNTGYVRHLRLWKGLSLTKKYSIMD